MIRKILLPLTVLLAVSSLPAQGSAEPMHGRPFLKQQGNQVTYDVTEEAWVSTDTARLVITINAGLEQNGISQLRHQIIDDLNGIADGGEWHITQFNQTQDNAGLDRIYAIAEARISSDQLTNIYSNVEQLSQPGIAFDIQYIDFNPSLEEQDHVRSQLREKIYESVNAEIRHLNQQFPDQIFKLHQLNFIPEYTMQISQSPAILKSTREATLNTEDASAMLPSAMNVSKNIRLTATVTLTSEAANTDSTVTRAIQAPNTGASD